MTSLLFLSKTSLLNTSNITRFTKLSVSIKIRFTMNLFTLAEITKESEWGDKTLLFASDLKLNGCWDNAAAAMMFASR